MRVHLQYRDSIAEIDFFPTEINWHNQNNQDHCLSYKTGKPPPFDTLFIKRWRGSRPVAHSLLEGMKNYPIMGTPSIYAVENSKESDGEYSYYFMESISDEYKRLDSLMEDINFLDVALIMRIVNQASVTFTQIIERGFIYTDFCARNILCKDDKTDIVFIDIDSSWTIEHLKSLKWIPSYRDFDIRFWGLWNSEISSFSKDSAIGNLPITMVLSLVVVWGRALAYVIHGGRRYRSYAHRLVDAAGYKEQEPLWRAAKYKDITGFIRYFFLKKHKTTKKITEIQLSVQKWYYIHSKLISGVAINWPEARQVVKDTLCIIAGEALFPLNEDISGIKAWKRRIISIFE